MKLTFWNHILLFLPAVAIQYVTEEPKIIAQPLAPTFLTFSVQIWLS